jgi:hypothetical protein
MLLRPLDQFDPGQGTGAALGRRLGWALFIAVGADAVWPAVVAAVVIHGGRRGRRDRLDTVKPDLTGGRDIPNRKVSYFAHCVLDCSASKGA